MQEDASKGAAPVRVLIIDDSPISCELIGEQLVEWGYEVSTADSGRAGVASFCQFGADVVVTDFMMPDMSGLEVLQQIKAAGGDVPVIMLSLHTQVATVLDALRLGAFDYVVKDQNVEPLHAALQRAISHLRLKRENARLLNELHQVNAQLEARVQDRTRMLQETNRHLQSERRRLQQTLERLHDTQSQLVHAEKMATVGLLTAGVAHEIKTPLAFVLPSFSQLHAWFAGLVDERDGVGRARASEMRDLIGEIKVALMCIRDVVQELGLFSRRGVPSRVRVNLAQVVDSVCRLFGSQLGQVRLEIDLQSVSAVCADPGQLRQVVLNLLVGAAGALSVAPAEGQIAISAADVGSYVELRVEHDGPPLPDEAVQQILNPLFSPTKPPQGAATGLAVSRHLVERMGGMVKLEAGEGNELGRIVVIKLPRWIEPAVREFGDVRGERQMTVRIDPQGVPDGDRH